MQRITITIDRVFDITTGLSRGRQPCTFFSFQSGETNQFGVALPGKPEVESGMTVSVLLEESDNWQTLLGWLDHRTGEITCWSRGPQVFFFLLSFPAAAALLAWSKQSLSVSVAGLLVLAFCLWITIRDCVVFSRARRALTAIKNDEFRLD
ncbi:hypothetical protein [Massilia sp. BKSP1R2A-1]|uniref:hypothetical protein n=1 Tax=Massilia sp. BKSP1R2A-1 TaxID=3422595 RepID=UPI003D34098C